MYNEEKAKEEIQLMDALLLTAPLIQAVLPLDCMIGIADRQNFVKVFNGSKIKLDGDNTGLPVPEQDAIAAAMKQDSVCEIIVPKEAFGFEFRSVAVPLKDQQGNTIGGLGIGFDLENSVKVKQIGTAVLDTAQETVSVIEELSASAEELSHMQLKLQKNMESISGKISQITGLLQMVNNISATSKMLGLNASIEAARAGEQGKGFSVVASEIRKMAENSTASIKEIKKTIDEIMNDMEQINNAAESVVTIGQQQAAATEEISASTQELAGMAEEMKLASQNVIG